MGDRPLLSGVNKAPGRGLMEKATHVIQAEIGAFEERINAWNELVASRIDSLVGSGNALQEKMEENAQLERETREAVAARISKDIEQDRVEWANRFSELASATEARLADSMEV